ncbi:MAG: squalene/phytoene synthase family protein [Candidatus Promineifilaceae bacterium]|nr:squalene/phytoene synthase family protein [Anaerolineaceae bacterium]
MTAMINDWENPLLHLAHQAKNNHRRTASIATTSSLIDQAYGYCEQITAENSRSFYLASRLLPPPQRRAVRALYAFCRTTDDIVDNAEDNHAPSDLQTWRNQALHNHDHQYDPIAIAWRDTSATYHIPQLYAEQLIDGVARDMVQNRYETFAELAEYAYGVASTVGLMSMHIIGYRGEEAIPYAVRLGVALQMTNILRDVAEDWRRGRLYLPQEELAAFGLSEADIAAGVVTEKWRSFMRFQIERNRRLYREAWPGIAMLNREGRLAIAAAADFYAAILHDIEQHDYDVFTRRAHIGKWAKLRRIPSLWWQTRQRPFHPITLQGAA